MNTVIAFLLRILPDILRAYVQTRPNTTPLPADEVPTIPDGVRVPSKWPPATLADLNRDLANFRTL
jgi:hypothetical protein